MGGRDKMKAIQQLTQQMSNNPTGRIETQKIGTGKRLTTKARKKKEKELRKLKKQGKKK